MKTSDYQRICTWLLVLFLLSYSVGTCLYEGRIVLAFVAIIATLAVMLVGCVIIENQEEYENDTHHTD